MKAHKKATWGLNHFIMKLEDYAHESVIKYDLRKMQGEAGLPVYGILIVRPL